MSSPLLSQKEKAAWSAMLRAAQLELSKRNTMRYPVAVWVENGRYSAEVPDLPGVITEADSIEELETLVQDAASGWVRCELDDGRAIPQPRTIASWLSDEDYRDCTWMLVDIDLSKLSDRP